MQEKVTFSVIVRALSISKHLYLVFKRFSTVLRDVQRLSFDFQPIKFYIEDVLAGVSSLLEHLQLFKTVCINSQRKIYPTFVPKIGYLLS